MSHSILFKSFTYSLLYINKCQDQEGLLPCVHRKKDTACLGNKIMQALFNTLMESGDSTRLAADAHLLLISVKASFV